METAGVEEEEQPTVSSTEDKTMEEVNMEQGKTDQVVKEARDKKAATAKRIADLKASMGRISTPGDNDNASMEEEELSWEDVANSLF